MYSGSLPLSKSDDLMLGIQDTKGTENETREAFGHGGLVLGRLHPYAALSLPKGLLSSAKSHFMITVTAR